MIIDKPNNAEHPMPDGKVPGPVVIIGAGPAGLTAGYELAKAGVTCAIVDMDHVVGGLAKTVSYREYRFDIGGHRFFTKVRAVEKLWHELLPNGDFLTCQRLSRIYYNKKLFHYPLKPFNALMGLGIGESLLTLASYIHARSRPRHPERSFEDWVSNRFGERLYRTFFKTYTEKVWGIPCTEITAEWAAQRIKGLSLLSAVMNALGGGRRGDKRRGVIKTLIDSFHYPRFGPGMMWEAAQARIQQMGGAVHLGARVTRVFWDRHGVREIEVEGTGGRRRFAGVQFISSMPIRELIQALEPPAPEAVRKTAANLRYRDFITVALIVKQPAVFPDNWIYIHDPDVRVGRIQNFKNWSRDMVPDSTHTCLGLEYFCFENDGLWSLSDEELLALGKKELGMLRLADPNAILDGAVVRVPKAYPVYDGGYKEALTVVRGFLDGLANLQLVGRNGMHRYNNQDHSMLTAMLAARNILGERHDLWSVNEEDQYHEEVCANDSTIGIDSKLLGSTQPMVPGRVEEVGSIAATDM